MGIIYEQRIMIIWLKAKLVAFTDAWALSLQTIYSINLKVVLHKNKICFQIPTKIPL